MGDVMYYSSAMDALAGQQSSCTNSIIHRLAAAISINCRSVWAAATHRDNATHVTCTARCCLQWLQLIGTQPSAQPNPPTLPTCAIVRTFPSKHNSRLQPQQ